jgi:hypothetical protein
MFKDMKTILMLVSVTFFLAFRCSGQSNTDAFNAFLANFESTDLPLNAIKFMVYKAPDFSEKKILKFDFDKYLREDGDNYWKFEEYFEYEYGGKLKVNNIWVVFYSRHFVPDNVFVQKGEFVLATFSLSGQLISALPIAGGYGDSLTFSSVINDFKDIKINFTSYQNDKEINFTKTYYMDNEGLFKSKPDN